ncbi:hypothetical protein NHF46_13380 [Arthrobacter alpinus]|nr:hypothetical protein [Arthrobacter alpinus]
MNDHGHQPVRCGAGNSDPQHAACTLAHELDVLFELFDLGQQQPGPGQQQFAGRCEINLPGGANQQLGAQLFFESLDLLGERGCAMCRR